MEHKLEIHGIARGRTWGSQTSSMKLPISNLDIKIAASIKAT